MLQLDPSAIPDNVLEDLYRENHLKIYLMRFINPPSFERENKMASAGNISV
jgi:hypothetical protein